MQNNGNVIRAWGKTVTVGRTVNANLVITWMGFVKKNLSLKSLPFIDCPKMGDFKNLTGFFKKAN